MTVSGLNDAFHHSICKLRTAIGGKAVLGGEGSIVASAVFLRSFIGIIFYFTEGKCVFFLYIINSKRNGVSDIAEITKRPPPTIASN